MTSPVPPAAPERRWWLLLLPVFLLIGIGISVYVPWPRPVPVATPDMLAALTANTRGVGRMERYEYPEAEKEFAEAVRIAPDWLPARVNLGISQFNQDNPEALVRARATFAEVLAKDPSNRHARYCLGIIASERGPFAEAYPHFFAVHELDPDDSHTLLRLGLTHPAGKSSHEARDYFERALKRNPYLNAARYNLALALRATDPDRSVKLFEEKQRLMDAEWEVESGTRYGEMGKYADVIGRDQITGNPSVGPLPMFAPDSAKVTLAPGAHWATLRDLGHIQQATRRFGGTMILFDFNGDGRPDVFLASAVVEAGKVRDLLLRNDGSGAFTDITNAAGLGTPRISLGAAAGDYDNDGQPDLVITGAGEQHLFRNRGDGTFENVSAAAGLDRVKGTCLGCGWTDIDQDGDLDLIICRYSAESGAFEAPQPGGAELFENVGIAPAGPATGPPSALTTAVRPFAKFADVTTSVVAFAAADLDFDHDADVLVLPERAAPVVVENDRLMRFRSVRPAWGTDQSHRWNGVLVLDANHDERSDLFLVRIDGPPLLMLSKGERDFTPGSTNSPTLKQAVTADLDLDGWPDVVGLGSNDYPTLLHNQGNGRLEHKTTALTGVESAVAVAVADLDGDGAPDLLTWSEAGPLRLHRNLGSGNNAVVIAPTGRRDKGSNLRTNADGLGVWIVAQSGANWTGAERSSTTAGLGQSLLPTALGIGKAGRADVVRLRWPDAVIQAELDVNANTVVRISETNRKGTSCPVLMAWDGDKFAFVTDFLGGGALGESGPDGSIRPPRPEESVKIEPRQLVAKDGEFLLKIAEPMDEVLYLDHLKLDVIDHPASTAIYPDERFTTSGPPPSQTLLAFRNQHLPKAATDHRGRDMLPRILQRDRRAVDGFATRSWLGYAEEHSLTLDFGELPADNRKWFLILAGWTEYPYPESMWAATRAGVNLSPPILERFDPATEKWEVVGDLGFPAGLPRVMTREVPKPFPGGTRFRIRTNMQVYWDQVSLAPAEEIGTAGKLSSLRVARATLAARGYMQEVYPDGRLPVAYDDSKTEPVAVNRWKGKLTRLGDVTDLLLTGDDRFVVCGPGDEITVRFDAKSLPALPPGWERSFVLRTRGYCKDTSTTTVSGGTVGPLPFRAMPNYPNFGTTQPPVTDADRWQTRPASGK
ncbi:MAG: hypothetical protein C0467_26995 [Planctomycetaceae bacterium]|nr:hypothetical protein [Planctomycetaceae bacterium]